jgi:purine-binding chemotaxis protein CheW
MAIKETEYSQAVGQDKERFAQGSARLQLVSFRLGGEEYGLEILKVQEIIRMQNMTRVPNAPAFIEGVINLRGKVIPVVGLRKRFGLDSREVDKETRIIVIEVKGDVMGFEVDSVSEVLRIPADTMEPPPRLSKHNNEYISGVAKLENRLLLFLDVSRLLTDTELLAMQSVAQTKMQKQHEEILVS